MTKFLLSIMQGLGYLGALLALYTLFALLGMGLYALFDLLM